ncbi:hypothetical protein [Allonocardiopsis opalescens]|nr:hypothetical protein [Allonocardiopsis opalescens]
MSEGDARRHAQAALAEVLNLCQFYLAYQPDAALLWRVAERSMAAAQESADPRAIGGAAWLLTQAHRDAGEWDAAEAVNRDVLEYLEPLLADAEDEVRAIWGALQFEAGHTAARRDAHGTAWGHWARADEVAARLPADYYDRMTSFSRVIMGPHAVTLDVELRRGTDSVRAARRTKAGLIPSRPRRGRHLIEVARAHHLANDAVTALGTLEQAHREAPETTRYNGYAKRIVLELTEGPPELRRRADVLADEIGRTSRSTLSR